MTLGLDAYLIVGALLFAAGVVAVLSRRNAIAVLIGIELMLNAANVNLVAFDRFGHRRHRGPGVRALRAGDRRRGGRRGPRHHPERLRHPRPHRRRPGGSAEGVGRACSRSPSSACWPRSSGSSSSTSSGGGCPGKGDLVDGLHDRRLARVRDLDRRGAARRRRTAPRVDRVVRAGRRRRRRRGRSASSWTASRPRCSSSSASSPSSSTSSAWAT